MSEDCGHGVLRVFFLGLWGFDIVIFFLVHILGNLMEILCTWLWLMAVRFAFTFLVGHGVFSLDWTSRVFKCEEKRD